MNPIQHTPGTILSTVYGPAIIISIQNKNNNQNNNDNNKNKNENMTFTCRIWRTPYTSLATESILYLHVNGPMKVLPAAPGLITALKDSNDKENQKNEKKEPFMVMSYDAQLDVFELQSLIHKKGGVRQRVLCKDVMPASAVKFYPLLVDLLDRSQVMSKVIAKDVGPKLLQDSNKVLESAAAASSSSVVVSERSDEIMKEKVPIVKEQVQQLWNVLKQEEMGTLLEEGQKRLVALSEQANKFDTKKLKEQSLELQNSIGIQIQWTMDEGDDEQTSLLSTTAVAANSKQILNDALSSTNSLLGSIKSNIDTDINYENLEMQARGVMEQLTNVAQNDPTMQSILQQIQNNSSSNPIFNINNYKSVSIFYEGTQRLQSRAMKLLLQNDDKDAFAEEQKRCSELFASIYRENELTLRLKSLELADAFRDRLIAAVELRSESLGGLDGMIARALSTVEHGSKDFMSKLDLSSSALQEDALLRALSSTNDVREQVLQKVEQSLCDIYEMLSLEDDESFDVFDISSSSTKLFNKFAERAKSEMEHQLALAEAAYAEDPLVMQLLEYARGALLSEDGTSFTNNNLQDVLSKFDEQLAIKGAELIEQGELLLDKLESKQQHSFGKYSNTGSNADLVAHAIESAKVAGLAEKFHELNVQDLIQTTENAWSDINVRKKLINEVCDAALDFLLTFLPEMPVPPLEGVRDGLIYELRNLSLKGLKMKKEHIQVSIAGIRATNASLDEDDEVNVSNAERLLVVEVTDMRAQLEGVEWSLEQTYYPKITASGTADVLLTDASIELSFELRKDPTSNTPALCLNHERSIQLQNLDLQLHVNDSSKFVTWAVNAAAGIFKSTIRSYVTQAVSSVITNNSGYLCQQLNNQLVPYWSLMLKTAKLSLDELRPLTEEQLSLLHEAERRANEIELVWREPLPLGIRLLLNDYKSKMIKVVEFPRGSQARSVCLNANLDPNVFQGATIMGVNGTRFDNINESKDNDDNSKGDTDSKDDLKDNRTLLLEALKHPGRPKSIKFRLADEEDAKRVSAFVYGDKKSPLREGRENYSKEEESGLVSKWKQRSYNVTVTKEGPLGISFSNIPDDSGLMVRSLSSSLSSNDDERCIACRPNDVLAKINDRRVCFSDDKECDSSGKGRARAVELFQKYGTQRPLKLTFALPYLYAIRMSSSIAKHQHHGPSYELSMEVGATDTKTNDNEIYLLLNQFKPVSGALELAGALIGDELVAINDMIISDNHSSNYSTTSTTSYEDRLSRVNMMLHASSSYPLTFHFERPTKQQGHDDQGLNLTTSSNFASGNRIVTKYSVVVEKESDLGCKFDCLEQYSDSNIVVAKFEEVPGPLQRLILSEVNAAHSYNDDPRQSKDSNYLHYNARNDRLRIVAVDGQKTPTYITTAMMKSVLQRRYSENGEVVLLLCDDEQKKFIESL